MPWAPIIGGVASLASGIIGANSASDDREAAAQQRAEAVKQFLSIAVPDPEQQKVELARYVQTGRLSPELEQTFQQKQTELGGIVLDPTSRLAEQTALQKMIDVANAGGMDAESKAKLQEAVNAANTNEQGQRQAIMQNFAQRGMSGSGAELAAELSASQGSQNRAAQVGTQSAADAEQRALEALIASANMGSTLHAQDYAQAADAARAQDLINQFNVRNSQAVAGANVDRSNQAQAANLAAQQSVSNANTGIANQEEMYNKGLRQQQFQNQITRAGGASGQLQNAAAGNENSANRTAGTWAGIGNAISQGAAAYGNYANNQGALDAYNKRTAAMQPLGSQNLMTDYEKSNNITQGDWSGTSR